MLPILIKHCCKISHAFTINYSKNASVVAPAPKASEDRKISRHLPLPIQQNSRRRQIHKDFKFRCFECSIAVVSLIKEILSRQIKPRAPLIIALDRTQWKENNILMVSVIYQKSIANILGLTTERRK